MITQRFLVESMYKYEKYVFNNDIMMNDVRSLYYFSKYQLLIALKSHENEQFYLKKNW